MRFIGLIAFLIMGVSAAASLPPNQDVQQPHPEKTTPSVPDWVKDAVFYQIFPERFANGDPSNDPPGTEPWGGKPKPKNYFGGDLQGIIDHLDYISSLGVNTIYLNPIFQSNSNHKYHTDDYLKIDSAFGNERIFSALVDSCHARRIRVILDGVFNHSGRGLFAFQDIVKNGAKSRYRDWFNVYSFPVGPANKPNYECWWGYGDLPKLMTQNPEVKQYLFDVTAHWMNFGIDGWRLDVPNEIPHPFWIEWRKHVKALNPDAYIVGEIWDDGRPWLQGDQFDAVMNYKFRGACLDFFVHRKTTASGFDSALSSVRSLYPDDVNQVMQNLLGSHDTERLLTLCDGDKATMKLAWLFQMTYIGAPMIYYGDEIGMTGGKDPDCRRTMEWNPQRQDKTLLEYMKSLIALRNTQPALRRGAFRTLLTDNAGSVYVFARIHEPDVAVVVINNDTSEHAVQLPATSLPPISTLQQVWPVRAHVSFAGDLKVVVPAKSGVVLMGGR